MSFVDHDVPRISHANLKEFGFDPESKQIDGQMSFVCDTNLWLPYQKHAVTFARRMDGPFIVLTSEGELRCEDGYLAVDARGYPYPIDATEFMMIYKPHNLEDVIATEPEGEA